MKFVYFGYDFMLPSVIQLMENGHELLGIMSFECDNVFNFNINCQNLTAQSAVPFITSRANTTHIESFIDDGCEVFLSGGYPHKIPEIDHTKSHAINVHPTALPYGRGLMPIPHIIMKNINEAAGFTAHIMTQDFDAGDILLQHKFDLSPRETVETYTAKIAMNAPNFTVELFKNLPQYIKNARQQDKNRATYIAAPTDRDRLLNWNDEIENIDKTARAFGRFGSIAKIGETLLVTYQIDTWREEHKIKYGRVVAQTNREITIAAKDGFVVLKDFQNTQQPR